MKKLFLSTLIFTALFSCKKAENADVLTQENPTDKIDSKISVTPVESVTNFKIVNKEQLKNLLAPKKNDSIYITNFFATWCSPCMREFPHFVEKMQELKGKPVKFTYVNVNAKEDWATDVSDFADEYDLRENIVLFDVSTINQQFFTTITKTWDGGSIPFTVIKKGDKEIENVGVMSKEELNKNIESFYK